MPLCTYLNENERNLPILNKDVAEWLKLAREDTGVEIVVREHSFYKAKWFFLVKQYFCYEVLWPVASVEYQIINFYREGKAFTQSSINTLVSAETVIAYLIGVCSNKKRRNSD